MSLPPPDEDYPHPFHLDPADGESAPEGVPDPVTAAELRMCRLSAQLREKDRWWDKCRDASITSRWIAEVKQQQEGMWEWEKLTDNMVYHLQLNFVIEELRAYADRRDAELGIEPGPFDMIFQSDCLIPDSLTQELKDAVRPLEDVPDAEKDWHPGSDQRVIDLVHPSICPLVYSESWGTSSGTVKTFSYEKEDDGREEIDPVFLSERFQWLPSDFMVSAEGTVKLTSPYINNISPEHHDALVPTIKRVMSRAVPMWELVLSELGGSRTRRVRDPCCVWDEDDMNAGDEEDQDKEDDDEDKDDVRVAQRQTEKARQRAKERQEIEARAENMIAFPEWTRVRVLRANLTLPDALDHYDAPDDAQMITLRERPIQVIVKLANIVLTPDKPEYPGGVWHVEGMGNESIVSTFIYYYDSDNIEPASLGFRQAVASPPYHQQDDVACMIMLYNLRREDALIQDVGSVQTKSGHCIAFPNVYHHRVSPFKLIDASKPGVRRILVFFLVDPTRRIPSATTSVTTAITRLHPRGGPTGYPQT
ncbi:unnamed protein product [Mycena citricolor]|uniref:Uncharacterized protein n=1 Tax=Mycena citricolor TaxID=2018698 RepID=A0AAD2GXE8_9AGAR|nr:unnamed protein product [Mycena citricolor]